MYLWIFGKSTTVSGVATIVNSTLNLKLIHLKSYIKNDNNFTMPRNKI